MVSVTPGTSLDFSKLPAAKTFAPSRDDILSTLGFFFGDPSHPEKLKDYSEAHAATYHFPGARPRAASPRRAPRPRAPAPRPRAPARSRRRECPRRRLLRAEHPY